MVDGMKFDGVVCWFSGSFGFITPDQCKDDVFVHHTGIRADGWRKLEAGQRVRFELDRVNGKVVAVNVERV